eukprot:XP_014059183.1 PREDICTED: proline-rich receptor-like protein kinase PERK1 [Salmo salar]
MSTTAASPRETSTTQSTSGVASVPGGGSAEPPRHGPWPGAPGALLSGLPRHHGPAGCSSMTAVVTPSLLPNPVTPRGSQSPPSSLYPQEVPPTWRTRRSTSYAPQRCAPQQMGTVLRAASVVE